MQLGANLQELD